MSTQIRIALATCLVAGMVLAGSALAMTSPYYRLDWFLPLNGSGGGPASNAAYKVNLTLGQVAVGRSSGSGYRADLGYWYGMGLHQTIFLPVVQK